MDWRLMARRIPDMLACSQDAIHRRIYRKKYTEGLTRQRPRRGLDQNWEKWASALALEALRVSRMGAAGRGQGVRHHPEPSWTRRSESVY